jgi:hypothetical protein
VPFNPSAINQTQGNHNGRGNERGNDDSDQVTQSLSPPKPSKEVVAISLCGRDEAHLTCQRMKDDENSSM